MIDFATRKVDSNWPIPGGGSPDMGNISIDGKRFGFLAATIIGLRHRYDHGTVKSIPVKKEPHGLTVWPQPGRYSLGHTGNLR